MLRYEGHIREFHYNSISFFLMLHERLSSKDCNMLYCLAELRAYFPSDIISQTWEQRTSKDI